MNSDNHHVRYMVIEQDPSGRITTERPMTPQEIAQVFSKKRPYRIVPKRDFGSGKGFLIKGQFVKRGFIVTDGFCNLMPGAAWFLTVADAMAAIPVYDEWAKSGAHSDVFWERLRALP